MPDDSGLIDVDRGQLYVRDRVAEVQREIALKGDTDFSSTPLDPPAIGRLGEIEAPTLVIVADQDTTSILQIADVLRDGIPNARKSVMPGTAHVPNMEKPDEFNRLVLDFLATAG